jgi:hypothetical protein
MCSGVAAGRAGLVHSCCQGRLGALLASAVEAFFTPSSPPSIAAPRSVSGLGAPAGPIMQAELALWQRQAKAIARLALLATSAQQGGAGAIGAAAGGLGAADLARALAPLAATLAVVYRRPYLSRGTAEKGLALLHSLLEVGDR